MAHFGQWRCRDPQTSMPGCPRGMCSRTPCSCWRCRSEHRPSAKQSWPRPHSTCIATASAILWGNTPRSGTSWPRPKTGVEQNTSRDWSEDSRRTIGRVSNRASTRPPRGTACSGWPRVNATTGTSTSETQPCGSLLRGPLSQGTSWRHGLPHRHCQGWSSAGPEKKVPPTEAAWKPSQCPGQGKRNQCQQWGKKDRRRQRRGPRTKTRCPRPVRHRPRREPNLLCVLRREVPEPVPQEHVTRLPKVPGKSSHPGLGAVVGPPSAPPPSMDHKSGPVGCLELTLDGAILTEAVTAACRKRDMAPPTTQVVPTSKLLDEDDFVELYHRVESTTIAWVHIHLGETNRSDAPGPEVVGDRIAAVAEHQVREGRHFTILGTVKRPEWEAKGFKRLRKATGVQHYVADESSTKRKTCGALAVFANCPWVRTPLRRHELPKLHTAQRQDTGPSSDQLVLQCAEAWAEHTSKEPLATGAERFVT